MSWETLNQGASFFPNLYQYSSWADTDHIGLVTTLEKTFDNMFSNSKKDKWSQDHTQDQTGKSKVHWIVYSFNTGDKVEIVCFDMAKHMNQPSGLDVGIISAEYRNWLNSF